MQQHPLRSGIMNKTDLIWPTISDTMIWWKSEYLKSLHPVPLAKGSDGIITTLCTGLEIPSDWKMTYYFEKYKEDTTYYRKDDLIRMVYDSTSKVEVSFKRK